MNKIIKYTKKRICREYYRFIMIFFPRMYADYLYNKELNKSIDWKNPKDLNEKINWLAFNSDTSLWTICADKYRVRDYVKEKGYGDILVPLYGRWDNIKSIDLNTLPQSFVLKTNCGCGDIMIVKDKSTITMDDVFFHFNGKLNSRVMLKSGEVHYTKIKPCIIAEKYLASSLIDYKIWCFNGEPFVVLTVSKRDVKNHTMQLNLFDLEWNPKNDWITLEYRNDEMVEKPTKFAEMLSCAKILAEDFPQVRVDFYEIEGRIYFGEMTFTSACGRMTYFTNEALNKMGERVIL